MLKFFLLGIRRGDPLGHTSNLLRSMGKAEKRELVSPSVPLLIDDSQIGVNQRICALRYISGFRSAALIMRDWNGWSGTEIRRRR